MSFAGFAPVGSRSIGTHTLLAALAAILVPQTASAEVDSGDTAWILTSTALVLFMTLPGLALFYGGLVRTKNVLSVLMQCFALAAVVTIMWLAFGYSLAFDTTGMQAGATNLSSFIGGLSMAFLSGVDHTSESGSIPTILHFAFQLTFAIITPALIVGTFAERMKFSAMLVFSSVWLVLVYLPICHMTWGGDGGWFSDMGVIDFAGGIVVHITAGVAALVTCIVIGPRKGYPTTPMPPHNLTMCVTGTGMLWVGWYGFNGGSELAANGSAAMAITVTQISAATAAFTWMCIEWIRHKQPSVLGLATGAIAGLAAVTPASGVIGPMGGLAIGFAAGAICWYASTSLKQLLGYDDSLDVFGVHGVGGFLGTIMAGLFGAAALGGKGLDVSIASQLGIQLLAALITTVYTAAITFGILKAVDAMLGLRVEADEESMGLDLSLHGESGYNL
jgi:Amt family ammonium transporter